MKLPIGTIINTISVLAGSTVGLVFHSKFSDSIRKIVFQSIGLSTLYLGMSMAFKSSDVLVLLFSMILGSILGELLDIETKMEKFSEFLKKKIKSKNEKFSEGLITAFLLFCVGSMTFVGALNEALSGDRTLLYTKSVLDGFASIALASTYGAGVLFSAFFLLFFQSIITVFGVVLKPYLTTLVITNLTAVGGLLIIGIGINLLEIKKMKVINMLPALPVSVLLTLLVVYFKS